MKDSLGGILYVGKSKNLKKRVQSYFTNSKSHAPKIKKLVHHVRKIEHIATDTEFEALMLECNTIQAMKPMYNRKMKNPLAYSYLVIRYVNGLRRIGITNNPTMENGNQIYGPYTSSKHALEHAVHGIMECFQMECNQSSAAKSPCLNYSIGRCFGVCLGGEAVHIYNRIMDRFIGLLDGTDRSLYEEMEQRMMLAAEQYDFEKAAKYRDYMESAKFLLKKEEVIGFTIESRNIVLAEQIDDEMIKIFLIKRDNILASCKFNLQYISAEQLRSEVKSLMQSYFTVQDAAVRNKVTRDEIDRAQIIYSYLQNSGSQHVTIHDEWLHSKDSSELDQVLLQFLRPIPAIY
ncbi:GIY-YIG nuclease family protein [Paenibacillus dakarensis]|uniref:GIY-YIG nuclease family protein n=1 Tax=Paenibacillus dakarensis TaxID=1527293 RepID=UPI0006D54868|nr:GIY-YIG nuclease family protein [Paenibacillus dakarensis]